jgi:hypothetical protein
MPLSEVIPYVRFFPKQGVPLSKVFVKGALNIPAMDRPDILSKWAEDRSPTPEEDLLLTISDDNTIRIYDFVNGKELRVLRGHSNSIYNAIFSADGKYFCTIGADHKTILWETATGKPLYTRLQLKDNDWLVYDEHYRFDGTPGAIEKLYFTCGLEVIDLAQMKDSLWVPGLVEKIMSGQEILINDKTKKATGVALKDGNLLNADAIVSNADVAWTYLNLIQPRFRRKYTDAKIKRMRHSISLFVLYFGTNRRYEQMAHHEIIMGPRYKGLMNDLFNRKHLADDFSLYLHRPTATDPTLAPSGCDSWYVLSPVPNLDAKIEWKTTAKSYRDKIIQFLEQHYLPNLSQHIVTEYYIDPLHFQDTLNSYKGSAFSLEPTLMQSAWFRPHNISEEVKNLYFVGAGTHPGAGIPGVMSSAKIVAEMIGKR